MRDSSPLPMDFGGLGEDLEPSRTLWPKCGALCGESQGLGDGCVGCNLYMGQASKLSRELEEFT
jgi:hypothetical protein